MKNNSSRFGLFIGLFALVFFTACGDDEMIPELVTHPNILLIIADDMGLDATPGYDVGASKAQMPNLAELATEGLTFDNAWAYPICSPTRASMLTGRYGFRTGVLNPTDAAELPTSETTLHAYLDQQLAGIYGHSIIGKWHLGGTEARPTEMGIGYFTGILQGGVNDYNSWSKIESGQTETQSTYITEDLTNTAIDWIAEQANPWFCWLAYTTPHTPFHVPPAGTHQQGDLPTDEASIEADPLPYYHAMIENMDHEIGRLLASMTSSERENTTIIFIGDNGTTRKVIQQPYAKTKSKGSLYQGGVHIPLIVSGYGVSRSNEREEGMVCSVDMFSTIAELAGINLPSYEDSQSFEPLLSTTGTGSRTEQYAEVLNSDDPSTSGYTISNSTFKLIQYDNGDQELYKLQSDPYEDSDLLLNTLSSEAQAALFDLEQAASDIRQ
ncbi:sulfatase-like hydrolase/transferase [Chitinophagales bacterium]|nr:sulfatase-like hydrolase/transferase [Chitinophagales bacterium]